MYPDPLRHIPEGQAQCGYEDDEHRELPDLDADVECQQRGDQVLAGELQGFAQGEGEAEAVHDAEGEGDDPARRAGLPPTMFSQRHQHDGDGDQRLDQAAGTTARPARIRAPPR